LAAVFDVKNGRHFDFVPVRQFLADKRGFMVMGGTQYRNELAEAGRYLALIIELKKNGELLVRTVPDETVDKVAAIVRRLCPDRDFDDPHLVALVRVSKCRLLCTLDKRAMPYLKKRKLYDKGRDRPSIYSNASNAELLEDRRLTDECVKTCTAA
jgi:hypothetical protein